LGALAVYAVFFLSGISGLIYQVVWVRLFGNVFGNSVYSAATVSAVFLLGLGLGSWAIGRWGDRRYRDDPAAPLRDYGKLELCIGALALALALVLPRLEAISALASAYTQGPEGWNELTFGSHALRYGLAIVLLSPITVLMGGTLTLLIRSVVARDVSLAGYRIGLLYGVNTLGAAVGAFLTDFSLVPNLGVFRTELVAVGLNGVAGVAALWIAARARTSSASGRAAVATTEADGMAAASSEGPQATAASEGPLAEGSVAPDTAADRSRAAWTGGALFLSGVAAMGMEILWFRFLLTVIGSYRAVFSLLLTVILVGICVGSVTGGWIHRRWGRPVLFYAIAQTLFVLVSLHELASFDLWATARSVRGFEEAFRTSGADVQALLQTWFNLRPILDVVLVPALLMGFTFPLANAHVQRVESSVGTRAGALYLMNTLGNVVGSLAAGFVLLPWLGVQGSVGVLAACAALALLPLQRCAGSDDIPRLPLGISPYAACFALMIAAIVGWQMLAPYSLIKMPHLSTQQTGGKPVEVLSVSEGINESVVVIEVADLERRLYTNGHSMSSTHRMSQRYMRLFSHLPLLHLDEPERVLVICFGVGNTLHAASLHPSVVHLEAVDLSKNIVRHAHYFSETNEDILEDERSRVFINDGRQHLRMQPPDRYDLITLEPPPINFAGVASLYSTEFYELARERLKPGGYMTQWVPAYQLSGDATLAMIRSFLDVFPGALLLSGHERELILLGGRDGPPILDPDAVQRRLAERPRVREDLEQIEVETLTALVGSFAADAATLERATRGVLPVTDDRPMMEYAIRAHLHETLIPPSIFDVAGVTTWCPDCFADGQPVEELAGLPGYLEVLAACYRREGFLTFSIFDPWSQRFAGGQAPDGRGIAAAIRGHRYLDRIYGSPCGFDRPPGSG
jgi:spermidine synthase